MDKSDHIKRIEAANNIDVWMDWMANNFETAKKDYPEIMELLKETLQENPLAVSVKIEQTPENFAKWKNEIENCLESTKVKKINTYLELIKGLLYHFKFPNEYNKASVEKIRPELLEMEAYFTNLLTKGNKQSKKTSYVWQTNPDTELPVLYSLMINKYKLITSETTYEQFKAVFTGQEIESINPIKWHQDNASELLYFNEAIINKVNDVWHIYQRLAACFVKPDGRPFIVAWKSLKTNIEINLSPDKQKAIDELVKYL
ncbi:MAG: hypothetical protein R2774_03405 [Saprospiraceae bacterium]